MDRRQADVIVAVLNGAHRALQQMGVDPPDIVRALLADTAKGFIWLRLSRDVFLQEAADAYDRMAKKGSTDAH